MDSAAENTTSTNRTPARIAKDRISNLIFFFPTINFLSFFFFLVQISSFDGIRKRACSEGGIDYIWFSPAVLRCWFTVHGLTGQEDTSVANRSACGPWPGYLERKSHVGV